MLQSLPQDFPRKLDVPAAIELLRTNCILGEKTLLAGVARVPYGHELVYDKEGKTHTLARYWQLPDSVAPWSEQEALALLEEAFMASVRDCTKGAERVGMHLSGGMDSRQVLGALLRERVDLHAFTYGIPENIDVAVAKKLAATFGFTHHYQRWDGVRCFKDHADEHFLLTDGMQALFHGHGIGSHREQKDAVDVVIHGHFLDLFIQGHMYDAVFEHDDPFLVTQRLYHAFDGGPCSIMRGDSMEPLMLKRAYHGVFREGIYREIEKVSYMVPEKRYDALYFLHHGLRRLLPQVQAGAQFLDFRLPGLNSRFFDVAWAIPGRVRKDRKLQEKLLLGLNRRMMKIPIVKDNSIITYMGRNPLKKMVNQATLLLREGRYNLLPRHYDYYGRGLTELANRDLYLWMKKEIRDAELESLSFLEPAYLKYLLEDEAFKASVPAAHYGALYTLARFVRSYL